MIMNELKIHVKGPMLALNERGIYVFQISRLVWGVGTGT
jgi:hypothetical protein